MSKIIDLRNKPIQYFMQCIGEDGQAHKVTITGDELFLTICPDCGREHDLDFDAFFEVMRGGDIYSTQVYCHKCSRRKLHV